MSGVGNMLQIGQSALLSHQSRLETIQNNIANASTEGYVRQRVDLVTLGGSLTSGSTRGVFANDPSSIRAPFFDRQIPRQQAQFGFNASRVQIESALEATIYPDGENPIADSASAMFSSMRDLSARPGDAISRKDFVASAQKFADAFQRESGAVTRERESVRSAAFDRVDSLNQTLERIASLDGEIRNLAAADQPRNELVDERNRLVSEVTDALDVRVVAGDNDTVNLLTSDGRSLVEGARARSLALSDQNGELSLGIDGVGGVQTLDKPGGTVGGMMHSHNDVLGGHLSKLDNLAYNFANEMNSVHAAGVGLDGTGGRDLFDVQGPGGAAASISVNAAIAGDPSLVAASTNAAGLPGGNDNLTALIAVQDQSLAGGPSFGETSRAMRQELGSGIRAAQLDAEAASASLAQLESLRASVEGVSLEEEMISLTEAQRGFEAAMKVVQAGDEMFDTILSLKR